MLPADFRAQRLNFRNYLADQVPNGTVYHMLQDSGGFLWFATEAGVFRFNGKDYQQFTMDDGLSENEVLKIYEDSRKRIWFLTLSGRLSYFFNNRFFNTTNDQILKNASFNSTFVSLFEDSRHNLWFAGLNNKYIKISPKGEVSNYSFNNIIDGRESFIYESQENKIILVGRPGFFEISGDQALPLNTPYHLKISRSFYAFGKGKAIFLADQGLVYMNGLRQSLLIPSHKLPKADILSYLYLDKNQDLWFTSLSDGVFHFKDIFHNKGIYSHYLPEKIISWVHQDTEKNLWFSTIGNGVFMLPSNFLKGKTYTVNQGLSQNKVRSVHVDVFKQIWLGYSEGQLDMISPKGIRSFSSQLNPHKDPYNQIKEIQSDAEGNIWLGKNRGLNFLKRTGEGAYQVFSYSHAKSLSFSVKSIAPTLDGKEIYLTIASGIEKVSTDLDKPRELQPVAGLPRVRTFTNSFDHEGTIWFSNVNGLNSLKDGKLVCYGQQHPLLTSRITDILETPDRHLVLATYGNGLLFFKDGKMRKQVSKEDGLPDNTCKKLYLKGMVLWVATPKGLGRIQLSEDKNYFSQIQSYTVSDGLISNEVNDVFVDDQQVYIATSKGLDIIPNKPLSQRTPPPILQFTGISARNQVLDLTKRAKLEPDQNRLLFKFTAITFQDPENVSYQYKMRADKNWIPTANTSIELTALEPGNHVFEVRAKKLNSAWSTPIAYSFTIHPPFWKTWWFLGLLALAITALVVASTRLYIMIKLRQQKRRLETEYRLQQERERIARDLHDNVGSHLAYIINSLEDIQSPANTTSAASHHDLREFTKQTITQLRETIWAIRQDNISIRELGTKIQKLIWQVSSHRPDFEYEVHVSGNQDAILTPVQALNLFRIAQEAVNNVFKHSQSACLLVSLQVNTRQQLEIKLEDKGIGFDLEKDGKEGHYGLANMQERARELGAYFKINSLPGRGTLIYIRVELKPQETQPTGILNRALFKDSKK
ncbi:MAG: two-component regulator propeller domain-containing protein [Adhaeribacter sp.]